MTKVCIFLYNEFKFERKDMNFLFEEPFKIFTYANLVLSLFFMIEILLIITGASFSKAFDKNFDIDKNVNMGDDISFNKELDVSMNYDINFFQVGKVPFLVIILSLSMLVKLN